MSSYTFDSSFSDVARHKADNFFEWGRSDKQVDLHTWKNDLRQYAIVLESPWLIPHIELAIAFLDLEKDISLVTDESMDESHIKYLQRKLISLQDKRGCNVCYDCVDMLRRSNEYNRAKHNRYK